MCEKHGSAFHPPVGGHKVGIALRTLALNPIHGLREPQQDDATGWYIWGGPYSEEPDFFQPVHVDHLIDLLPMVMPFLGLEPGFKFITDSHGYADVWHG